MYLNSNEQITFISKKNREYDFVKKIGAIMRPLQLMED